MRAIEFKIGCRVEGGSDDDRDSGTIVEAAGADARHPMAGGENVLVAWDSGVRTWTPASELRRVA